MHGGEQALADLRAMRDRLMRNEPYAVPPCGICDGLGSIGHYLGEGDGFDEYPCDACGGTGKARDNVRDGAS